MNKAVEVVLTALALVGLFKCPSEEHHGKCRNSNPTHRSGRGRQRPDADLSRKTCLLS